MLHVGRLSSTETTVDFMKYSNVLARCKNLSQWKARALCVKVPAEAVLTARSPTDALRMLAMKFIFDADHGDLMPADLASRDTFINGEVTTRLSQ